tara:strand:- start:288 stop:518 length:231 start_codon:yes stop_codon:yes gene_type:complete
MKAKNLKTINENLITIASLQGKEIGLLTAIVALQKIIKKVQLEYRRLQADNDTILSKDEVSIRDINEEISSEMKGL